MRFFYSPFFYVILAAVLSQGCTTYVGKIEKAQGYSEKLRRTNVVWTTDVEGFYYNVSRSARGYKPKITEEDRQVSRRLAKYMKELFAEHAKSIVVGDLRKASVDVVPVSHQALTKLTLFPASMHSECAPLDCFHTLKVRAELYDHALDKMVWSGEFRMILPDMLVPAFEDKEAGDLEIANELTFKQKKLKARRDVVQSFSNNLLSELKSSGLL